MRQEKDCAICRQHYHAAAQHTIPADKKETVPRLVDQMSEIIQGEPYFQLCDKCRDAIQNPQYVITENER